MKMLFPSKKNRQKINKLLDDFYHEKDEGDLKEALLLFCTFYKVPVPTIVWYEYIDRWNTWGRCKDNGEIHLIDVEDWENKGLSGDEWIRTLLHELKHYLDSVDEEIKADSFAQEFHATLE